MHLYTNPGGTFISSLFKFLTQLNRMTGEEIPFERFVEIIARYHRADIVTELGIKPT